MVIGGPASVFVPFVETYVTSLRTFARVPIQVLGNLLPERRLATATCMEQCTLLRVDGATFRRALEDPDAQRTVEKKVRPWLRVWRRRHYVLPAAKHGIWHSILWWWLQMCLKTLQTEIHRSPCRLSPAICGDGSEGGGVRFRIKVTKNG